ncbi:hypothetical protein E2C01_093051 [Portunus trituberculatus]|uniref:Uncharacterized protein n=1 Tax=Portunus trituberculatus TaxID=210409 RepID=A0A5B7JNT2_PORTR|nr:hypothetical protein [Portunus trituberculatus]
MNPLRKKAEEVLSHSSSVGQEAEERVRASRGPSVTGSRKRTITPSGPCLAFVRPAPPCLVEFSCVSSASPRANTRRKTLLFGFSLDIVEGFCPKIYYVKHVVGKVFPHKLRSPKSFNPSAGGWRSSQCCPNFVTCKRLLHQTAFPRQNLVHLRANLSRPASYTPALRITRLDHLCNCPDKQTPLSLQPSALSPEPSVM